MMLTGTLATGTPAQRHNGDRHTGTMATGTPAQWALPLTNGDRHTGTIKIRERV